ncbi:MAG: hypothetical protein IPG57_13005 [Burkholderiales bacterium]|jgi:hypothetical protein|nr:hypothetical protein [Burkholderiales bacterium]
MTSAAAIRLGLREATATLDQTQFSASPPEFTYLPPSHARALDLEATLVEGIRGAGKSFWWAQLASEVHRQFVQQNFPEVRIPDPIIVKQGFGVGLKPDRWPDADTLADLVTQFRPRSIWRAVVGLNAGLSGDFGKQGSWRKRVSWVEANPELFALELDLADRLLERSGFHLLVLFDALDRLADDWEHIQPLAKGLLQVALDLRSTRRIRFKIYTRPDILQDPQITGFPDFAKLLAGKASLEWRRADLYALLFQCLGNTPNGGTAFRTTAKSVVGKSGDVDAQGRWRLPAPLRVDEDLQEAVFERVAGKAMGSSVKRGKPYTWLVNHLLDGLNQVSPRSFFAALGTAATDTAADAELALDYKAIQRGVQKASEIRVGEITEDYPWVRLVMEPLRSNLTVPCQLSEIDAIWKQESTLNLLKERLKRESIKLPPLNLDQGTKGILMDLESLGMLQRIDAKRIQVPDVYRIAYGLGRRGGVRPLK